MKRKLTVVQLLLFKKANPNICNNASHFLCVATTNSQLTNNTSTQEEETPLLIATRLGEKNIVKVLLVSHADPNMVSQS